MFQRIFDEGLAQSSYVIACPRTRQAAVIDPRRDADVYLTAARQRALRIVWAIETHIHADFVSGARELAAAGARTLAGPGAALGFDHREARDGERLQMGDLSVELLHTPGHTPEHMSVLVTSPGEPVRVFTGDTLFAGAVGRPDLLGHDLARALAEDLFDSVTRRLLALDDRVQVHPGHGAGSLCGAGIGSEPFTTIGQERRFNPMLQHSSRDLFVEAVLADLPDTPPYFPRMKRVNREGPPLLGLLADIAEPAALAPRSAAEAVARGAILIDLRSGEQYAWAHPERAINIGYGSKIGYWAGWVVPTDAAIVLLLEGGAAEGLQARRQLLRVGLDNVVGYIEGGVAAWAAAGLPIARTELIPAGDLFAHRESLTILDVRTRKEWERGHIDGALHVPVGEIPIRSGEIPRSRPVATVCEAGYRSILAASLLERAGFTGVVNVAGGVSAAAHVLENAS